MLTFVLDYTDEILINCTDLKTWFFFLEHLCTFNRVTPISQNTEDVIKNVPALQELLWVIWTESCLMLAKGPGSNPSTPLFFKLGISYLNLLIAHPFNFPKWDTGLCESYFSVHSHAMQNTWKTSYSNVWMAEKDTHWWDTRCSHQWPVLPCIIYNWYVY